MKREHLQTLRRVFKEKYENTSDFVALEHVRALDVLIKADIQKEINDAGDALNAKYALPILQKKVNQMEVATELSNKLFAQAVQEAGTRISQGVYDAAPNAMGKIIERYKELCSEHNLNPATGLVESITNTKK